MIEAIDTIARRHPPFAVGTVGRIEVKPNSRNVVPGETFFTVDFRHPSSIVLDEMEKEMHDAFAAMLADLPISGTMTRDLGSTAGRFRYSLRELSAARRRAIRAAGARHGVRRGTRCRLRFARGAVGDDLRALPDGISHNEAEYSSKEQCANGAQVLLQAVLDYDRHLAERHGR